MSSPNSEAAEITADIPESLDPAARRRIQNRLNQRASRKRRAAQFKKQGHTDLKWVIYTDHANTSKNNSPPVKLDNDQPSHELIDPTTTQIKHQEQQPFSGLDLAKRYKQINDIRRRALQSLAQKSISPNATLCVSQYNILRAMFANAKIMGLTMELLNEDIASQFNIVGQPTFHLPASLVPSKSQKEIVHHPWVDIIPILSLREALLIREDLCEEDEFCGDLYGVCASTTEVGLRVWGEAWDPFAYEASEYLLRKWSWMIEECPDIVRSTNYWRRKRGEKALVL
ncbi:hypothetical protein N7499_008336 [Penicillium canescens]|uniref:BZIP domain-containing protein n=1 Tax=Penicillium canescens TaxID=5083 RepID=A0AAD6N255_PENCN|nr:uncharacterized protein N7446_013370 [Penicillium canescens]KAJ5985385.1 hypothetical protein N7522_012581 [Penicillium canescens]KAJ6023018.1 hypothetical protein N7460_013413 [Penicillium canescens]KAJ6025720.1 hypothetical protein N7444_013399 [Penicillium canescens]KAJ6042304.1 hypothetical protein N7446_013370 [Penicillium canescens]KAJ6076355.1 hypothetical protein N7499_008336 [Penicillium canescens]